MMDTAERAPSDAYSAIEARAKAGDYGTMCKACSDRLLEVIATARQAEQVAREEAFEPTEQSLEAMARAMCAHVEAENGLTVAGYKDLGVGSAASFVDKFWPNYVPQAKAGLRALKDKS